MLLLLITFVTERGNHSFSGLFAHHDSFTWWCNHGPSCSKSTSIQPQRPWVILWVRLNSETVRPGGMKLELFREGAKDNHWEYLTKSVACGICLVMILRVRCCYKRFNVNYKWWKFGQMSLKIKVRSHYNRKSFIPSCCVITTANTRCQIKSEILNPLFIQHIYSFRE